MWIIAHFLFLKKKKLITYWTIAYHSVIYIDYNIVKWKVGMRWKIKEIESERHKKSFKWTFYTFRQMYILKMAFWMCQKHESIKNIFEHKKVFMWLRYILFIA